MYRPDYHRATRNAYRTLLATGVDHLPVDVAALCARCQNTKVMSFHEARHLFDDFEPLWDGPSRMAFTMRRALNGKIHNLILWNDEEMSPGSGLYRFSLAHELGHIVLRHSQDASYVAELEANCYAQHLLCPRPVLEVLQPRGYLEISYLCGVSCGAARLVYSMLKQENKYVDRDMWNGIFAAFDLDMRRNTSDFLTQFEQNRLARVYSRGGVYNGKVQCLRKRI